MSVIESEQGEVPIQYHGFWIGDFGSELEFSRLGPGLITTFGPCVWVSTGCESGSVRLLLELHSGPPPIDDLYEENEDAALRSTIGDIRVQQVVPADAGDPLRLTVSPGLYTIRVSAAGRTDSSPISFGQETYRLQLWPADET